jgi:selenide,water dikinase
MKTNRAHFPAAADAFDPDVLWLLYDPQTSGGLLASVAGESADAVSAELASRGVLAARVGRVEAAGGSRMVVA